MAQIPVIGLAGKARTGKDTVANFIILYKGGYRYPFAQPMRDMLRAGFGIDLNDPYWIERKENIIPALGKSPRQLMQTLGTEWGRQCIGENTWVTLAKQRLISMGPGMVITDVRFENEATWIRSIGGRVVHVKRAVASVNPHPSEYGITPLPEDGELHNEGDHSDLQLAVKDLLHIA